MTTPKRSTSSLFLLLGAIFSFVFLPNSLQALNFTSPYGQRADSPLLQSLLAETSSDIPLSKTKKSYQTLNRFGFDVIDATISTENWLIQELLASCPHLTKPILDVGGGYGGLTCKMLVRGAKEVIYNDLEERHLLIGLKNIPSDFYSSVHLNTQAFPESMHFPPQSLGAIVLHRVIHFLTGAQIEAGLKKLQTWLIPGGKVYIVVMAPQHTAFRTKVLPAYNQRWEEGAAWPGENLNVSETIPNQAYNLPPTMHVMDGRPLVKALKKNNFVIEKEGFISMQRYNDQPGGNEAYGVIARYQPLP